MKHVLISIAIVSFWIGVWGLSNLYLSPDNPAVSFVASLVIGLFLLKDGIDKLG